MKAEVYTDMARVELRHWWFRARTAIVGRMIKKYVSRGSGAKLEILDLGCGSGNNGRMLSNFGEVDGIEPEAAALAVARDRGHYRKLTQGIPTVDGTRPEANYYDLVVMTDVLEHIEKHEEALQLVKDSLKPGGKLLLTVPALMWLWSNHDETHLHFRRYTKGELKKLVKEAEFKLHYSTYFNFFLFPLIAGVRTIKRVLPSTKESADTGVPPRFVNEILFRIFNFEGVLLKLGARFPIGVSVLLVCEKPE